MNKIMFIAIIMFCFITNGYAQKTLSDYSYIVIPEQYEFLSKKDKFQLNSLTKFLFNKYGFHAFFENEVPKNINSCDGLYADIIKNDGFIYTKLIFVIKDCNDTDVYQSIEGKSKLKEYKKAYQDALRKAFAGIISLEIKQKSISLEEVVEEIKVIDTTNQESKKKIKANSIFPSRKYNSYKMENDLYLLRKTDKGYSLYKDVDFNPYAAEKSNGLVLLGEILISKSKVFYLGLKAKLVDAHFDESLNLIIDKPSEELIYKFVD